MADEQFGVNPSKKISFNDGYTRDALMQSSAAAKEEDAARDRAMKSLQDAFYNSQEVTQDQGIAAALLAAIPTFGGYLIGKSVGSTEVPAGVTNIDPSKLKQTGAYAGGLAGAGIGQQAAGGYLTSVLAENKEENKVHEQLFNTEMDRAKVLEQKANLYEGRADQFNAQKAMMPLELEQYAKQQDMQLEKQKEFARYQSTLDDQDIVQQPVADEIFAAIGKPELVGTKLSQKDAQLMTNALAEDRRNQQFDYKKQLGNIPSSMISDFAESAGVINQLQTAAQGISNFSSWADLRAAATAGGLDPNGQYAAVLDTVDRVLRSRSGAAAPVAEQDRIKSFLSGDATVGPKQVANFLLLAAERERQFSQTKKQGALSLQDPKNSNLFETPIQTIPSTPANMQGAPSTGMPNRANFATPAEYLAALKKFNGS